MNRPPAQFARVLLVTDRTQLPVGRDLVATIADCLEAGLHTVVLRELDLPFERRAELAAELSGSGVRVISAHESLPTCVGVQVPSGAPAATGIWGRSCHSVDEVTAAAAEGALWATLSPFAATPSKPGYGPPVDRSDYAGHSVPVYALGGITPDNAAQAVAAGAHGVAVMGAVMRAERPRDVVAKLIEAVGSP